MTKKKKILIAIAVIFFGSAGVSGVLEALHTPASERVPTQSSSLSTSDKEAKLKHGMKVSEVKEIMGKPETQETDETGHLTLEYPNGLVLVFNDNNTLQTSIGGADQVAKQASSALASSNQKKKDENLKVKSFAKKFGLEKQRDVLKKDYVYATQTTDSELQAMWSTGQKEIGTLYRVDDLKTGITRVYQYKNDETVKPAVYTGTTVK